MIKNFFKKTKNNKYFKSNTYRIKSDFLKIYDLYFKDFKNKKINILEIGIDTGNSLKFWRNYFSNRSNIIGIDIIKYNFSEKNIFTFQGRQEDINFLSKITNKFKKFDIIIDDGSHDCKHIIKSFNFLFNYLNNDGIYIVEDLQTSYYPRYNGSRINLRKRNTSMNFLKNLSDSINYEHFDQPFPKSSVYDGKIKFVHFFQNLAIVKKGTSKKIHYNKKNKQNNIFKKLLSKIVNFDRY
jgi:23S rRNA U2552 (ribose-2'-O)-methylase RlmE/FtsJ